MCVQQSGGPAGTCPPSRSLTPPTQQDGRENRMEMLAGQDKTREIANQLGSWAKQPQLAENLIHLLLIKIDFGGEKQKKLKLRHDLPSSAFPRLNFIPSSLTPLPPFHPRQCRAEEKFVVVVDS